MAVKELAGCSWWLVPMRGGCVCIFAKPQTHEAGANRVKPPTARSGGILLQPLDGTLVCGAETYLKNKNSIK